MDLVSAGRYLGCQYVQDVQDVRWQMLQRW